MEIALWNEKQLRHRPDVQSWVRIAIQREQTKGRLQNVHEGNSPRSGIVAAQSAVSGVFAAGHTVVLLVPLL